MYVALTKSMQAPGESIWLPERSTAQGAYEQFRLFNIVGIYGKFDSPIGQDDGTDTTRRRRRIILTLVIIIIILLLLR
jgi:hypothetical protein